MHATGRRKSIYHDRDVTPDIRARRSTIYKLTDCSLALPDTELSNPQTPTFLSLDSKIPMYIELCCPFTVPKSTVYLSNNILDIDLSREKERERKRRRKGEINKN